MTSCAPWPHVDRPQHNDAQLHVLAPPQESCPHLVSHEGQLVGVPTLLCHEVVVGSHQFLAFLRGKQKGAYEIDRPILLGLLEPVFVVGLGDSRNLFLVVGFVASISMASLDNGDTARSYQVGLSRYLMYGPGRATGSSIYSLLTEDGDGDLGVGVLGGVNRRTTLHLAAAPALSSSSTSMSLPMSTV
ncbi:hypothetical protein TKK_0017294 [Trichogramma kaykai]